MRLILRPGPLINPGRQRMAFHNTAALLAAVLCLFALTGCLDEFALPTPTPIPPTATATLTPTSTATIIWFPATATFTPAPTIEMTPTPDMHPPLGKVLFKDPFTDKTLWPVSHTGVGSIAYGKGELTLAVSTAHGTLATLRKAPILNDFYMQVDVLPSLCRNEDMYGLLLRATSSQDTYRLLITCSGKVRLERVKGGRLLPLQDWTQSGQIFPGGMLHTRLGIWAQGEDLHVFINDVYQFSVRDTVWDSGSLGLFARSAGETPLTVSFSDLSVYKVDSVQRVLPTAVVTKKAVPGGKPSPTEKP